MPAIASVRMLGLVSVVVIESNQLVGEWTSRGVYDTASAKSRNANDNRRTRKKKLGRAWQGRVSGLNKLGRGQAETRTAHDIDPESAPAEVHLDPAEIFTWRLSGGALSITTARRPSFRLPPSQLVRHTETSPAHPSQLVRRTEASLSPFTFLMRSKANTNNNDPKLYRLGSSLLSARPGVPQLLPAEVSQ